MEIIRGAIRGIDGLAHSFARTVHETAKLMPSREVLEHLHKVQVQRKRLQEIGILPHKTFLPFVDGCKLEGEALSDAIETHLDENWPAIEAAFLDDIDRFDVDEEARETFKEALAAHRSGHYRSVCRLLFPEFERIVRFDVFEGQLKGLSSQRDFRKLAGELGIDSAKKLGGMTVLSLFHSLRNHIYLSVEDSEQIEKIRSNPIPNRNACLHGILIYNTAKNSINMLIISDFVYRVVGILKEIEK